MHEHDQDLIMALAEGTLGPEEAAAAEAEFAACTSCAEELSLQRLAVSLLHEAPAVALNEFESHRIRRNVRRELGIGAEAAAPAGARRRRFMPVAVLGGAAALLLAVVFAGGALQDLSGDGADTAAFDAIERGEDLQTGDSPAAAIETAPTDDGDLPAGGAVLEDAVNAEDSGSFVGATPEADEGTRQLFPFITSAAELEELRALVADGERRDAEDARVLALRQFESSAAPSDDVSRDCGARTAPSIDGVSDVFEVAFGELDGAPVVVVAYVTDPPADSVVIAHDASSCEPLARVP